MHLPPKSNAISETKMLLLTLASYLLKQEQWNCFPIQWPKNEIFHFWASLRKINSEVEKTKQNPQQCWRTQIFFLFNSSHWSSHLRGEAPISKPRPNTTVSMGSDPIESTLPLWSFGLSLKLYFSSEEEPEWTLLHLKFLTAGSQSTVWVDTLLFVVGL